MRYSNNILLEERMDRCTEQQDSLKT